MMEMGFFSPGFLPFLLLVVLAVGGPSSSADAWGVEGHSMICNLAQRNLTLCAKRAVKDLLPASAMGVLASVCSWADTPAAKSRHPGSEALHFANIPDYKCDFVYSRDCACDKCVVGAINTYSQQLRTYGSGEMNSNLTESLMFLTHFMGDVHQPLHVGHTSDRGGNKIRVYWLKKCSKKKVPLHRVWDTEMIRTAQDEIYHGLDNMTKSIEKKIHGEWAKDMTMNNINDYASESIIQACEYAYMVDDTQKVENDMLLTEQYFEDRIPIVEKRIAQAGVRLAALLNDIFSPNSIDSRLRKE